MKVLVTLIASLSIAVNIFFVGFYTSYELSFSLPPWADGESVPNGLRNVYIVITVVLALFLTAVLLERKFGTLFRIVCLLISLAPYYYIYRQKMVFASVEPVISRMYTGTLAVDGIAVLFILGLLIHECTKAIKGWNKAFGSE